MNETRKYRCTEKERERCREKYHRLGYCEKYRYNHRENSNTKRHYKRCGVKIADNAELHHWDYNRRNDVFVITSSAHKIAHSCLTYDKECKMFYYRGVLLDTYEKHRQALKSIFAENGITLDLVHLDL